MNALDKNPMNPIVIEEPVRHARLGWASTGGADSGMTVRRYNPRRRGTNAIAKEEQRMCVTRRISWSGTNPELEKRDAPSGGKVTSGQAEAAFCCTLTLNI
jgi:hypothetical protein